MRAYSNVPVVDPTGTSTSSGGSGTPTGSGGGGSPTGSSGASGRLTIAGAGSGPVLLVAMVAAGLLSVLTVW